MPRKMLYFLIVSDIWRRNKKFWLDLFFKIKNMRHSTIEKIYEKFYEMLRDF